MDNGTYLKISSRAKDITGLRSGRLVAMGPVDQDRYGLLWKCQCDCGNESIVRSARLTSGEILSCGCLLGKNSIHGMTDTPVFRAWRSMKSRCFNPKDPSYCNYGARGITVCDEWQGNFVAFFEYVSKLPNYGEDGYSLDRIDNNGNYEPGNARWATVIEQRRNQRRYRQSMVTA